MSVLPSVLGPEKDQQAQQRMQMTLGWSLSSTPPADAYLVLTTITYQLPAFCINEHQHPDHLCIPTAPSPTSAPDCFSTARPPALGPSF